MASKFKILPSIASVVQPIPDEPIELATPQNSVITNKNNTATRNFLLQQLGKYSQEEKDFYKILYDAMKAEVVPSSDPEEDSDELFKMSLMTFKDIFCKKENEVEVMRLALNMVFLENFKFCPDFSEK